MNEPPVAFDVAGRPYCSACGDSGLGPCAYHADQTLRRVAITDDAPLGPCPKCRAHAWTDQDADLFIRNMVRCRACGLCIRRELLLEAVS